MDDVKKAENNRKKTKKHFKRTTSCCNK